MGGPGGQGGNGGDGGAGGNGGLVLVVSSDSRLFQLVEVSGHIVVLLFCVSKTIGRNIRTPH